MEINIRQMKIKNCPDYLFNDNLIINVKDFDSSLLKIYTLSYNKVFSLNIYYIKYIPPKNLNHMCVNHEKDFLYLFVDDVDEYIEENDGIRQTKTTDKSKEALKIFKKLWEETKRQIEVINDDGPIAN